MPRLALLAASLFTLCAAIPARADVVRDCDDRVGVGVIAEPWEEMSRSYANHAVRVAVLDYEEPAASSLILMVLYWQVSDEPYAARICKIITAGLQFPDGWAGIRIDQTKSRYDPAQGLILSVPVLPYDYQGHTGANEAAKYDVTFAINRSTGALTLLP